MEGYRKSFEHGDLQDAVDRFVHLWSDMAAAWGINRTMAQIHALLYAEARPLNADDLMERLSISRGNASMNLRELMHWDLIRKISVEGERKEYFTAETDVWTIVSKIVEQRQQREIAPVLEHLRELVESLPESSEPAPVGLSQPSADSEGPDAFRARMQIFIDFLEMFDRFTHALLPYISKENLSVIKQLVRIAEAGQTFKEWRTGANTRPAGSGRSGATSSDAS